MNVLIAQLDFTVGALDVNVKKIIDVIERGKKERADVVVFSELAICGYPPEDLLLHHDFIDAMEKKLDAIVPHTQGVMVVVGLARRNPFGGEKPLLNSVAVLQDGEIVGFYDKWLLPTYDVFDERRYFEPGRSLQVWEWRGKKIGLLICEDIWQHAGYVADTHYPFDPVLELQKLTPDLVLNASASPYAFHKPDIRVAVCQKAAKTLECPLILCCQVGGNDQLLFDGYSVVVDAQGVLRQLGKGFAEDVMRVDFDAKACPCHFEYDAVSDLYAALVLGTKDYFLKEGFKKAVIGLSGGIDSALVASIAVKALGAENVLGVALPSRYSSEGSLKDAAALAKNLKMEFEVVSIEPLYQAFLNELQPLFEKTSFDVTEENLQSRCRGVILMALSNKFGYLLLSTGNKSELALGYCTLYGDMAGGLAVINDVSKTQVYELARFVNRHQEVIPQSTLDKPPSAELRPNQKDSDTLPSYEMIDAVLQAYVEEFLSAEEIAKRYGFARDIVEDLIRRIHAAEYKRRQATPGIRISKKAFRVGHRYPIVQGWARHQ